MTPLTPVKLVLPVAGHLPHSTGVQSAAVAVRLQSLVSFFTIEYHLVLSILVQVTSLNHLAHELSSSLVALGRLFGLLDSAPEVRQFPHVALDLLLFGGVLFLFFLNLGLGTSSLASDLE